MKKTISINIGGVVFHIEEDGYEKLRDYLGSVQRYFSSFADSKEILSDIEGRIAERFLAKQKLENKQVISLDDVGELIAAMGTVADFEAIDQAEDLLSEPLQAASARPQPEPSRTPYTNPPKAEAFPPRDTFAGEEPVPRRLYRDLRRKLVGGVAAGIAHYFTVDPLWVRLAFLFLVIGLPAGSGMLHEGDDEVAGSLSGLIVLVYIAMWIAFPGSHALEEDKSIKKFYRDPDRKVIGGVAAGVASYFGVDIGVVRFLWVLSILFFGTGFLIYIVLWIISPSANTLTEKMEMQGEPITLSNIETNIKRGLNLEESPTTGESGLTRLLLFPFRAMAVIISGLGKLLKGIGPVLRVLIGAVLVAVGAAGLLAITGAVLGLSVREALPFANTPPMLLLHEAPSTLLFSVALLVGIPFAVVLLLGLTLIANRRVASGTVWLTLLGLWIVGLIGTASTGAMYQRNFARRGEIEQTDRYAVNGTPVLDEYDNDEDNGNNWDVRLLVEGYAGDSIQVEREISSRGRSAEDARRNAMDLSYRIVQKDSVLRFDEEPTLAPGGRFRDQEVRLRVLMPYDRPFVMTRNFFYRKISNSDIRYQYRELDRRGDREDWRKLRWAVKRDSGLVCLNLPEKYRQEENDDRDYDENDDDRGESLGALSLGERGEFVKEFDVRDFRKVEVGGAYAIEIRQGDRFAVSADGDRDDVEELTVTLNDGILLVKKRGESGIFNINDERIGLRITMPDLRDLQLSGASKARVSGFENLDRLNATLSGAVESEIDIRADRLEIDATGASKTTLKGRARKAEITLTGACQLDATNMEMDEADVRAVGASRAQMGKVGRISKTTVGASKID